LKRARGYYKENFTIIMTQIINPTQVTVHRLNEREPVIIDLSPNGVATCNNPCDGLGRRNSLRVFTGLEDDDAICMGVTLQGEPLSPHSGSRPVDKEHFPRCGMVFSAE